MKRKHLLFIWINMFRVLPSYLIALKWGDNGLLLEDLSRWKSCEKLCVYNDLISFGFFMLFRKEFRTLVIKRVSCVKGFIIRKFFNPLDSLYIMTDKIGGGLYIQHGFSTIIAAKSIGDNCYINQQVTIGYEGENNPVIGDNVRICCGAKVIGGVSIGDNSIIAAGAVVVHNVPSGEAWGGCRQNV